MLLIWVCFMGLAIYLMYIQGVIHERAYPVNTFLPHPEFGDFFGIFYQYAQGLGGVGYGMSYFPALYLPMQLLETLTRNQWQALWISQSLWLVGSLFVIFLTLRSKGFLVSTVAALVITFSYPSLFAFHTGNIESWVSLLLIVSAYFAIKDSWLVFGILIGVAGAFKGVPLLFLLIPWFICKWRMALKITVISLLTTSMLTLVALVVLPGGIINSGFGGAVRAITSMRQSQAMYITLMVDGPAGIHFGHSFLNAVHAIWGMGVLTAATWGPFLATVMIGLSILALERLMNLNAPLWMMFAVIGCLGCLAPATSTDYKLLYLAPAILIFLKSNNNATFLGALPMYMIIFAMSPKPYLRVGLDPFGYASVYLTAAFLIAIPLACIAVSSMKARNKHDFNYDPPL